MGKKAPSYSQRNEFFYNALQNLQARTGSWPDIRVGANSEDRTDFDEKIQVSKRSPISSNPVLDQVQIIQETQVPPTSSLPYPEVSRVSLPVGF
jgi:hypothetical protein